LLLLGYCYIEPTFDKYVSSSNSRASEGYLLVIRHDVDDGIFGDKGMFAPLTRSGIL